jgi:hypothetical protein
MGTVTPARSSAWWCWSLNPLDDIRNSQKVHAVVTRGRLITSEQYEKMLADVEAAASRPLAGDTALSRGLRMGRARLKWH